MNKKQLYLLQTLTVTLAEDEIESAGAGEARLREPPFPVNITFLMDCKTVDE